MTTSSERSWVEDGQLLPAPFVTVSRIFTTSECGLLGLVSPDFVDNGYVYFFVTVSRPSNKSCPTRRNGNVGLDETRSFRAADGRCQPRWGALRFGPDGNYFGHR